MAENWWNNGGTRNTPVGISVVKFIDMLKQEEGEQGLIAIEGIREAESRGYTLLVLDRGIRPEIIFSKRGSRRNVRK